MKNKKFFFSTFVFCIIFSQVYSRHSTAVLLHELSFIIWAFFPIIFFMSWSAINSFRELIWRRIDLKSKNRKVIYTLCNFLSILLVFIMTSVMGGMTSKKDSIGAFLYILTVMAFWSAADFLVSMFLFKKDTNAAEVSPGKKRYYVSSILIFALFNLIFLATVAQSREETRVNKVSVVKIENVFECQTKSHRIRVDSIGDGFYSYKAFSKKSQVSEPSLYLTTKEVDHQGSGVCATIYYVFRNGNYTYNIGGMGGCGSDNPDDYMPYLRISISDKEISSQICRTIE